MENNDLDQTLRETLSGVAPIEVHERTDVAFLDFAERLRQRGAKHSIRERHPLWWLWPGVSLASAAAMAILIFSMFFAPTASWSQVVERFRTLRFFNATVYYGADSAQPPEKVEVWATQDHRTRVHYRGLIFFGQAGQVVKVLRAENGAEIPVAELKAKRSDDEMRKNYPAMNVALGVHESIGKMQEFSLDGLLGFFSGKREGLHPVLNMDASIAPDMQAFDFVAARSSGWIRLWVLKKSELPIRIRSLNPDRGEQVEAVFDYFTQMPDEAFDPGKVQASIRGKQGSANKLYALLKDPGGRPLTPEDLFAKDGLHLPEIAAVGRTEEGVLWVQSRKAENRRVDGGSFGGWGKLTDNLGQNYLRVQVGHRLEGDIHEEYYIPLNYRADYRKPAAYTLTCVDREEGPWQPRLTPPVGSVEVKEWQENASVPKLMDRSRTPDSGDFIRPLLRHFVSLEDWERFDRLAAAISGASEENSLALFRDIQITRKLDLIGQRDQAAALRTRLLPLVKGAVKNGAWEEMDVIDAHISDLVRAGKRDAARPLANEFVADVLRQGRQANHSIGIFIFKLHDAGMKQADIQKFFDKDVLNIPEVKEQIRGTQLFRNEQWDTSTSPRFAAWRDYLSKLAARYNRQPLPAELEFIEDKFDLSKDQTVANLPMPDHPEYMVNYLPYSDLDVISQATAETHGLDYPQVVAARSLNGAVKPMVCVYRANIPWAQIWAAYLKRNNVETVEKTVRRKVLVAHYDGRKLPNCFEVGPLDGSSLGAKPVVQEGGTGRNADSVLKGFERAMNNSLPPDDPQRTILINETGLPVKPGPNQSPSNICLAYQFAFWTGPEANKLAFDWFRDNFGITFQEEERETKMLELQPASRTALQYP